MRNKIIIFVFFTLVSLSLLAPLWVFKDLLFPYVTSKAFYFRILIELALPFYVFLLITRPNLRPNLKQPLNVALLAFLAINVITTFTGINVQRSFWGNFERMGGTYYLMHLVMLYFYVMLIGQLEGKWLKRFLQLFLIVTSFVALNGVFGKLGWGTVVPDPSLPDRISSTLGNPIYVGSYLMIPLFVALFLGFEEEKWGWKIWYGLVALLQLVGIFLSGTRGALVGLLAGMFLGAVVYIFLMPQKRIRAYGLALVGIVAVISIATFFYSNRLPQGSVIRRLFTLEDSNTKARIIQWGVALRGYKDFPLLGVGPENYYYIGNKYFNPAIYQYDRSWFDKPHNYILEILVTNGPAGLLAYLAMLVFGLWALFKAYKGGFFNLASLAALFAALIAYQIQNLTVFDTIPASLTFYSLLGFMGYLWHAASQENETKDEKAKKPQPGNANLPFAWTAAAVALAVAGYAVFVTNVVPAQACKAVNYGYAYGSVDAQKASDYFDQALSNPFNFDPTETANKFGIFVAQFAQSAKTDQEKQLAKNELAKSISYSNEVLAQNGTYAATWESLATDYMINGYLFGSGYDARAEDAVNKALELAPKRPEAQQQLVQLRLLQNRLSDAEVILNKLIAEFPADVDAKQQLAVVLHTEGNDSQAAPLLEQAIAQGYAPKSYAEIKWLASYYDSTKQYKKEVALLESVAAADASNIDLAVALVNAYYKNGQVGIAKQLYDKVVSFDSSRTKDMPEFAPNK